MRLDGHISSTPAKVRRSSILRDASWLAPEQDLLVIANGMGSPRLWGASVSVVRDTVVQSLKRNLSDDARTRFETAYRDARVALGRESSGAIDQWSVDAALLIVGIADHQVTALTVGPVRVYVAGSMAPQRLSPRGANKGLLEGSPNIALSEVGRGDIVLAGSEDAFSVRGVARVGSVIGDNPKTRSEVIASLLTEPARDAGVAAVAAAIRIS